MDIHWHGGSWVELKAAGCTVLAEAGDPAPAGTRLAGLAPDIHARTQQPSGEEAAGEAFVIDGPGEYELRGVFVIAVRPEPEAIRDASQVPETVFCFESEGVAVCLPGRSGRPITQAEVEALGQVDVLLLPLGLGSGAGIPEAVELVNRLDPAIVIPLYDPAAAEGEHGPLARFLHALGASDPPERPYLRVDPSRLPEETQVVLLTTAA